MTRHRKLVPLSFGTTAGDGAEALTPHGSGVYVAGWTLDTLHGSPNSGSDTFLRKYDSTGVVLWGRQFGNTNFAVDVASDSSNNAYVAGDGGPLVGATGTGSQFLRKYSPSGSVLWTKQFGSGDWSYELGGVAVSGKNVYVVGTRYQNFQGDGPPPPSNANAFIRRFNSSGTLVWSKTFGTSTDDWAFDVAAEGNGNAYVVGYTSGILTGNHGGDNDMFIRKYTPSGSVAWTKQLNYGNDDVGRAVAVSGTSVYIAGDCVNLFGEKR